jgi:hypothetical protein
MTTLKTKLLLVLFFCSISLTAQNVKIGIGGGIMDNMMTIKTDYFLPEITNKVFPRFSAFGDFRISESFWISAAISYIRHGYSFKDYSDYSVKMNYLYLDFDIKYKYKNFYSFFGPTIGFFLNGTEHLYYDNDIKSDNVQSPNIGLNFGVGYEYQLTQKIDLFIQSDYALGFTDIMKASATELKSRGVSLQTGIKFGL